MKKVLLFLLAVVVCISFTPAYAQEETVDQIKEKGASQSAYEHASDRAIFHRITDWFATIGKSPEEKERILTERRAKRAAQRAEKEARKAKKLTEEKTRKAKEATSAAVDELKKDLDKRRGPKKR